MYKYNVKIKKKKWRCIGKKFNYFTRVVSINVKFTVIRCIL